MVMGLALVDAVPNLGFFVAVLAAVCTGTAAVLQAIGARKVARSNHVDPRLLWRILHSRYYVAGLMLNGLSFTMSLVALRSLPLFVVEAIVASNLAVVAVLATCVLRARLLVREWFAIGGVVAGLVLLVVSVDPSNSSELAATGKWALLGAAIAMGVVAFLPGRRVRGAAVLGLLAGLTYGICGVSSRVLGATDSMDNLLTNPVTYALALGGILGTLLYATALQRGSVTAASAMTIVGQTLGPSLVGWLILDGHSRPGFTVFAITGFVLTVSGALALARHAHVEVPRP